ncbi:MAG: pyridoxal phosphate-dependent aminotransferase [Bifidobacterium psychraerophilum]|uniref:pyridoxal phosphate-dependent aminotransferase n=1 Tax=Bifidobacterium psychraerophilum TaxID=218140 RepID=UPI0039E83FCE
MVAKSATLVMNEMMQHAAEQGRPVINLGFGESGLPVLPVLRGILSDDSARNAYPAVEGSAAVRTALSSYFTRRGIPADPGHCLMAPGSKALLFALMQALKGDIVLPRPSWVTYAAQSTMLDKRIIWVDAPESAGGVPDPALLPAALENARRRGLNPTTLLLTSPDNPSGTVAGRSVIEALLRIAREQKLFIISDEIYRDLAYDHIHFTSPAELAPERTFVTTGLSKSMALGGWRIGAARFPQNDLGDRIMREVIGTASEIWSGMPIFLEPVAEYCFSEPADVLKRVAVSRLLHQRVSTEMHRIMVEAGASCRTPSGAFYIYPTFQGSSFARSLDVTDDTSLSRVLFERFGIAVLPGSAFGDLPERMGLRVVTSMIYGDSDEERLDTLHSSDPLESDSVRNGLERVRDVFLGVPSKG